MAEKFILHVEVLFGAIDDLEHHFACNGLKGAYTPPLGAKRPSNLPLGPLRLGMSHVREARMLCRKTVDLFTLLSHTQETGARRMGMTQELLALVTGLAHYLKILIRIALTGALKLERDYDAHEPMTSFLDKLHMLAIQGANPSAKRMIKGSNGETLASSRSSNISTEGVTYGFKSLAPEYAGESPFMAAPRDPSLANVPTVNPPSDLCVKCNQTVEEDCVRLGTYQRWHSSCIQCVTCSKVAAVPLPKDATSPRSDDKERDKDKEGPSSKPSTQRRPPANVGLFVYETDSVKDTTAFGPVPNVICCVDHAHNGCRGGFQSVSRLEQYAFLLNVALRRLYTLLKKRGVVPASPGQWPKLLFSILSSHTHLVEFLPSSFAYVASPGFQWNRPCRRQTGKTLTVTRGTLTDSNLSTWIANFRPPLISQNGPRLWRAPLGRRRRQATCKPNNARSSLHLRQDLCRYEGTPLRANRRPSNNHDRLVGLLNSNRCRLHPYHYKARCHSSYNNSSSKASRHLSDQQGRRFHLRCRSMRKVSSLHMQGGIARSRLLRTQLLALHPSRTMTTRYTNSTQTMGSRWLTFHNWFKWRRQEHSIVNYLVIARSRSLRSSVHSNWRSSSTLRR